MPTDSDTISAHPGMLADALSRALDDLGCEIFVAHGETTVVAPAERLLEVAAILSDSEDLRFDQLIDLCGVDYCAYGKAEWDAEGASVTGFGRGVDRDLNLDLDDPQRFAVVVHLLSLTYNWRMRLRVFAGGVQPMVDSLISIWPSASWFEREAFDLFGILFRGHPDLRRLLTDYGFVGYPFRKDFPLSGHVEMRYDPAQGRVVYEPVTVEPRVLVPKTIREDSRYVGRNPGRKD
jgi:NADH-quinone oxidoreductase subunit C